MCVLEGFTLGGPVPTVGGPMTTERVCVLEGFTLVGLAPTTQRAAPSDYPGRPRRPCAEHPGMS